MTRTLALSVAAVLALTTAAAADLTITEVAPQTVAGTAGAVNGDWWELSNSGPIAINLAGYSWTDTEDQLGGPTPTPNFFPAITINPGQSIIILEENDADAELWRTNWLLDASVVILSLDDMVDNVPNDGDVFSGLGNANDGVFFYAPGAVELDSYLYPQNTRGISFEADRFGADLGLSVVGENGAYLATNGNTGSPGFSVPSPAAASLLAMAGLAAVRRRR